MLPSDPGYIPACTDERIRNSFVYKQFLSHNTDPYAPHSRNDGLIDVIESAALANPQEIQ